MPRNKWLKGIVLRSPKDNISLHQYTRYIEFLNEEIRILEKEIALDAAKESVTILMSMTGIDYYAMLITSEIDDISRFPNPKKLVS